MIDKGIAVVEAKDIIDLNNLVLEPIENYQLFSQDYSEIQKKQSICFNNLEKGLPIVFAHSLANQVNFQNAIQTPIQRWFPYREGYSIKLVNTFIDKYKVTGNVFDPFSGSGTTLLSARTNNLNSFGIDVNPISTLISKASNCRYSYKDKIDIKKGIQKIRKTSKSNEQYETQFNLAEKVFNNAILQALLQFKHEIFTIRNKKVKDLFFSSWLSIIEKVSNVKKEGNGIKYKNRKRTKSGYITIDKEIWENDTFPENRFEFVKSQLLSSLEVIYADIKDNYGFVEKEPKIFRGSCLDFDEYFNDEIHFTFYSPPYCNCFDYFEIHKVELWLGDFVNSKEDLRSLRNTGFRSNTNSVKDKIIEYTNENLESLISYFNLDRLWSKKIPSVVRGYFDDTNTLLIKLYDQTKKGGLVGIVVGNSAYTGVIIPTDLLIAEMARNIGFTVEKIYITRHLTTSSQQKKELEPLKSYLRESVVLLKK